MSIALPRLPYSKDALEPFISQKTLDYHYDKHHGGYIKNLNKLIEHTEFSKLTLVDIIKKSDDRIFNNAAQSWNHTFYWYCMTPENNKHNPSLHMKQAIEQAFGSLDAFKTAFTEKALGTFGSGWTWLVKNTDNTLRITSTSNAGNPLTAGLTPLLTCDVWEHAYYIDVQNNRGQYLENFWKLIDWPFVERNLKGEYNEQEAEALLQ